METNDYRFILFEHVGKVYAENEEGIAIELGTLRQDERGKFGFRLNGDAARGYGFASVQDALANLVNKLSLAYVQAQFATTPGRRITTSMRRANRMEVRLDSASSR
jgi:hypothetical protein